MLPYIFAHAVYVRCGASLFTPSTFPRKGIGVGPGGRGSLPEDGTSARVFLSLRAPSMVSSTATTIAKKVCTIMEWQVSKPRKNQKLRNHNVTVGVWEGLASYYVGLYP